MRAYMQTHATASRLEFQMKRAVLHVVMALLASGVSGLSQAAELVNAFDLALRNDRAFLNAQAEERLGQLDANRAQLSYLPTLFMEQGRSAFERSNRTTVQAIQPLVDLDKYATFKESPIRAAYAQATLGVKEIDLSKRLYVNYSSLVRSNSLRKLALLEAQALDRQVQRAQRRFDLGSSSVMDITLAKVQHSQAMARYQSLQNDIQLARQKLFSLTGASYEHLQSEPAEDLDGAVLSAQAQRDAADDFEHPMVRQAKEQLQLAESGVLRAKGSYLPQVNLIVRSSHYAGMSDNYQGVQLSFPTGVSAYGMQASQRAMVDQERARRALEEVQEQLRLERESTELALKVNAQELVFRTSAVKDSEKNVAATEKAYEAGIVKASDVVSAILASFDVRRQRLMLLMSMADQQLINSLNRGVAPRMALEKLSFFFKE